jgi:hypothetical protein
MDGAIHRVRCKLASVSATMAGALRRRGTADAAADLAAVTGTAVLRIAVDRWLSEPGPGDLPGIIAEPLAALKAVTAGTQPGPRR